MDMKTFYTKLTPEQKAKLAKRVGTVVPYLSQIAHGHAQCGASMAMRIVQATNNKVSKKSLRPDLWG